MTLKILFIGAHPDDCEISGGGTAALFSRLGHEVKFISMTHGGAGHHLLSGKETMDRRSRESIDAAQALGVTYEILDTPDGHLMPTLENRFVVIQKIREWEADVVITHRPNDYHPDHRYTSQIVQDAAYLVMVPAIVMQTPPLSHNPLFLYFADHFQKPTPFQPDIAIAIDEVLDAKIQAIHAHQSQVYEWLPWINRDAESIPDSDEGKNEYLKARYIRPISEKSREALCQWYGSEKGQTIQYAEAFEICEYGMQPDEQTIRKLFPMLG